MIWIEGFCEFCGKAFRKKIKRQRLNTVAGRSCGSPCSYSLMGQNRAKDFGLTLNCAVCKKDFHRNVAHAERTKGKHYCSHKCHARSRVKTEIRPCAHCGKSITRVPNQFRAEKAYCSLVCRSQNMSSRSFVENAFAELIPPGLAFIRNDRKQLNPLELDFYFPTLNVGVELNGQSHYRAVFGLRKFRKQRSNDRRKKKMCIERGIKLFCIKLGDCRADTLETRFGRVLKVIEKLKE